MKNLLIAAAALSAFAMAAPASAQGYRHNDGRDYHRDNDYRRDNDRRDDYRRGDRYSFNINAEQRRIDARIHAGLRSGRLSEREAGRIRAGFGDIARLEARYRRDGLTQWERADLSRRLDRLNVLLTAEMNDRNNYRG